LITSFNIIAFLIISFGTIYAQGKTINEFLEWPPETNFNFVFISIIFIISFAILANYFWSKRKGSSYSEE